jgi:hypothetical protein
MVLQNLQPNNSFKNKLKLESPPNQAYNTKLTPYVKNKIELDKLYENSKKYIKNKLSLEFMLKQFYFLENTIKSLVDLDIVPELVYDLSQKIPWKVLDFSNLNEYTEPAKKSIGMKGELKKELGIDQSQSIMQIINQK